MKIKMKKTKKRIVILIILTMLLSRDFRVTMPGKVQAAGYGLKNPVTDKSSVTTWDCVYFENYWQDDTNGDGAADNNDEKQPIKWWVLSVDGDDNATVRPALHLDLSASELWSYAVTLDNTKFKVGSEIKEDEVT